MLHLDQLHIRNAWDRQVAEGVLSGDEYRLRPLAESGVVVRWIVDIGAHIGAFTLAAKSFWPEAKVVAVEPSTDATAIFQANTAGLADVYHFRTAIARRGSPPQVRLSNTQDDNYAARFTVEVVEELSPEPHVNLVEWCPATNIIDLLAEVDSPAIDILKLDCEGAEALILQELHEAGYLARVGYICGEWHHWPSIPLIESALRETHRLELYRHNYPWGGFYAHPYRFPIQ